MRRSSPHTPLEMQLKGYRLATAEIVDTREARLRALADALSPPRS